MSDTHTETAPLTDERRLVRPAQDRVVAGVCAGLGRYFDVDPLVYRVALAGLVLLGGVGVIVYAMAWLVIPDEGRGESIVGDALCDRRRRPLLGIGVAVVGVALVLGIAGGDLIVDPGPGWVIALLVGLAIVWWQLRDRPAAQAGGPSAPVDSTRVSDTEPEPPQQPPPPPTRRRIPIFLPTMGVVLAGAGILGVLDATDVLDVDWIVALAVGVALVGIAVAVGAFFGGVAWLAVVGTVLAAVVIAATSIDIPLEGPIGERTEHPTSVRDLESSYPVSIGQLNLDLRDLALPRGTTDVKSSVGIGQLNVIVPDGVRLEVDAHVAAGEATVLGEHVEHIRGDTRRFVDESAGKNAPKLQVEADVGLGALVVRRP